jgi:hypothetical protein
MVLCVSVVCVVLFSFISYPNVKGVCIILTLIAGKLESWCLSAVVFVKEIDSVSGVTCYPDCARLFDWWLSSTSKQLEGWRNAADKVRSWAFLSDEYRNCQGVTNGVGVLGEFLEKYLHFSGIIKLHFMKSCNFMIVTYRNSVNMLHNLYIVIYLLLCTYTVRLQVVFVIHCVCSLLYNTGHFCKLKVVVFCVLWRKIYHRNVVFVYVIVVMLSVFFCFMWWQLCIYKGGSCFYFENI